MGDALWGSSGQVAVLFICGEQFMTFSTGLHEMASRIDRNFRNVSRQNNWLPKNRFSLTGHNFMFITLGI